MAVSLIRRIFTISLLYKTAQEGTSKKMQGHPLHVLDTMVCALVRGSTRELRRGWQGQRLLIFMHFHGVFRLCTKNPVSTLTRRSIRPFRPHCEGFFAAKEVCFYSKKSYIGTTFGAKPGVPRKPA
jgi:hypothetical protein